MYDAVKYRVSQQSGGKLEGGESWESRNHGEVTFSVVETEPTEAGPALVTGISSPCVNSPEAQQEGW